MTVNRRRWWVLLWLLGPVLLLAFHYGPGQRFRDQERARAFVESGRNAAARGAWEEAVNAFDEALSLLPEDAENARARCRIRRADAMTYTGQLREATEDLQALLDSQLAAVGAQSATPPDVVRDTRAALAAARYYSAWVRRLEGAPPEDWLRESTQARQHFRLLAESGEESAGPASETATFERNLEAAVRLERMDASQLKGLPLPEQVRCSMCRGRGKGEGGKGRPGIGEGEKPGKDMRGAGKGRRPPAAGS